MTAIAHLLEIMAQLRSEKGCPWDKKQTLHTLKPYLLEECYEVLEAIDSEQSQPLKEELGDLLFQIVFCCQIAQERWGIDFEQVCQEVSDKLIRRHPHVFEKDKALTPEEVAAQWEKIKKAEKKGRSPSKEDAGGLDKLPAALPALLKSYRLQARAASAGFDWPDTKGPALKVREELAEVEEVLKAFSKEEGKDALEDEIGDLLFSVVNLARKAHIDPESALQRACKKFSARFAGVEKLAAAQGLSMTPLAMPQLLLLWQEVKKSEKA